VGTCIGAGDRERALRTAWIGAAIAAGLCEAIGVCAALFPQAWLGLFDTDPALLEIGARYLRVVGPAHCPVGLGLALYFASQGAGRLLWPVLANLTRLTLAAAGGWFALRWHRDVSAVFVAQAVALAAFGAIVAAAVAKGAWFVRWRRNEYFSRKRAHRRDRRCGQAFACETNRTGGRRANRSFIRTVSAASSTVPAAGKREAGAAWKSCSGNPDCLARALI